MNPRGAKRLDTRPRRVLLLGGTLEARNLASALDEEGHVVTTSLAGRTLKPDPTKGKRRVGGFGGEQGLATYLTEHQVDVLIDATHPYATQISENAQSAAELTRVPLLVLERPPWTPQKGDCWKNVSTLERAVVALPMGARVLLALGRQSIEPFATRKDCFFLLRVVDPPKAPLSFAQHDIIVGKPHSTWQQEARILNEHQLTHLVTRNSGGLGAAAKLEAARRLSVSVVMIDRPQPSFPRNTHSEIATLMDELRLL